MRTNTHPIEPEEVMAYLDGELPADRASRAAEHLGVCRECQALAADLRSVSDRMMEWRVEAPVLLAPSGPAEIKGADAKKRRWYLRWPAWAVAAACVFVFVVAQSPVYYRRSVKSYMPVALQVSNGADPSEGPLVAHTTRLSLVANDFDRARAAIDQILKRHNGYIAEMTVNAEASSARTLQASVRTPDAQLDATISEIKSLGRVLQEARTGEEVTQQSIDLNARLANARNSEQRLTELLKRRTDKLADVLQVENQISTTRGQIEQMEAERKNLNRRIQYAKGHLWVPEVCPAQCGGKRTSSGTRLRNAAVEGDRPPGESLIGATAFALSGGPVVLVWCAILFFPARYAWRRFRR